MDNGTGLVILGLIVLGLWFWLRRDPTRETETRLRRICFGDHDQMERLIEAEMTRTPGISRAEAASRAVDRYKRDNS
jgi:hypothetical protein